MYLCVYNLIIVISNVYKFKKNGELYKNDCDSMNMQMKYI